MKMKLSRMLGLLIFSMGSAYTAEPISTASASDFISCPKTYVSPEQITCSAHGIFVQTNNTWFKTDAIFHDENGTFIISYNNEWSFYWTCPKCKYGGNTAIDRACRNCGYRG